MDEMMQDARKTLFDVVIIWKVDRLGRSVIHMTQIVKELENLGVDLIISTLQIDTRTASGKFVFGIMAQVAEFERNLISERTKLALKHNKRVGKRGPDRGPRKTEGYKRRYQKKVPPSFV